MNEKIDIITDCKHATYIPKDACFRCQIVDDRRNINKTKERLFKMTEYLDENFPDETISENKLEQKIKILKQIVESIEKA
jgi:hypothetical protein